MSVLMILRVPADGSKLEEFGQSSEGAETLKRITDDAKSRGAIHHQFYANDSEVVVVDEWETAEGFQEFFSSQSEIPTVMQSVGASGEPKFEFLRKLNVGDEF
jgi:heme-degrading monooxygenase HmoA